MRKFPFYFIFIGFLIFFLFLTREYLISQNDNFQIFIEKNVILLKNKSQIFSFGDNNSPKAKMIIKSISSHFYNDDKILRIENFPINKKTQVKKKFVIDIFSKNISRGKFNEKIFFFINEPNTEEWKNLQKQPITFDSDFLVLKKNIFQFEKHKETKELKIFLGKNLYNFLPFPKEGIIFLTDKKISKNFTAWAAKNKIPIISAKNTKGASLELKNNKWEMKVRE